MNGCFIIPAPPQLGISFLFKTIDLHCFAPNSFALICVACFAFAFAFALLCFAFALLCSALLCSACFASLCFCLVFAFALLCCCFCFAFLRSVLLCFALLLFCSVCRYTSNSSRQDTPTHQKRSFTKNIINS